MYILHHLFPKQLARRTQDQEGIDTIIVIFIPQNPVFCSNIGFDQLQGIELKAYKRKVNIWMMTHNTSNDI